MENKEQSQNSELKTNSKKICSKISFSISIAFVITEVILGILLVTVLGISYILGFFNIFNQVQKIVSINSLVGPLATLIWYPIVFKMLKNLPRENTTKEEFSKKSLFKFFWIACSLMYMGSFLITQVIYFLSKNNLANPIADALWGDEWIISVIYMIVLAPILEELLFRKLFISVVLPYGERLALIFSSVCFSLMHGNLVQIFYTFMGGLVLGYVYIKSKNIKDTILLHFCINVVGILPTLITRFAGNKNLDIIGLFIVFVITIVGLVLLFKNYRKWSLKKSELSLKEELRVIFLNPGTILFIILVFIGPLLNMVLQS